ncbi:MAG TPA: hypothetical protein VGC18_12980 [Lacisediminihabitans sp.]|uniref:hypothetical protein n=1 Tax=Lacisediminihabitans sp. TaxID=2787631 RepID=UPI002EDB5093
MLRFFSPRHDASTRPRDGRSAPLDATLAVDEDVSCIDNGCSTEVEANPKTPAAATPAEEPTNR